MMKEVEETSTAKYDFVLDNLGFADEPLDQRAVVFCKILNELNIPFKKYYTSPQHRYMRSMPSGDFADMGMIIIGTCDENYAAYAMYLFRQKMAVISQLNKML